MNDSASFLKKQLEVLGHGNQHDACIDQNVKMGVQQFTSKGKHEFYQGNRKLETELNFKRGNKNEKYFWNSYDATLTNPKGQVTKQRFYVDTLWNENREVKTIGYTCKEACNLLDSDHLGNSR